MYRAHKYDLLISSLYSAWVRGVSDTFGVLTKYGARRVTNYNPDCPGAWIAPTAPVGVEADLITIDGPFLPFPLGSCQPSSRFKRFRLQRCPKGLCFLAFERQFSLVTEMDMQFAGSIRVHLAVGHQVDV